MGCGPSSAGDDVVENAAAVPAEPPVDKQPDPKSAVEGVLLPEQVESPNNSRAAVGVGEDAPEKVEGLSNYRDAVGAAMAASQLETLKVPTGLGNLQALGKASLTGYDVRSGNPSSDSNRLVLSAGRLRAAPGGAITRLSFSYRYVVGYSSWPDNGKKGPSFELVAFKETGERLQSIYASAEFAARPFCWDSGEGGHPKNYSSPVSVEVPLSIPLDEAVQLEILFTNNSRNMHLQGAEGEGCELQMEVQTRSGRGLAGPAEPKSTTEVKPVQAAPAPSQAVAVPTPNAGTGGGPDVIRLPDYTSGAIIENKEIDPGSGDFTFTAMIKPSAMKSSIIWSIDRSVDKRQCRLEFDGWGYLNFVVNCLGSSSHGLTADGRYLGNLYTPTNIVPGDSAQVTITRSLQDFKIYVDGVLKASHTAVTDERLPPNGDGKVFRLGSRFPQNSNGAELPFLGSITGATYFKRCLSATEVEALGVGTRTKPLVGMPETPGTFVVVGNQPEGCEQGRFFEFRAADLTAIIGPWASQGGVEHRFVHVKGGDGAVLRARNSRTGKEDGVLLWGCKTGGGAYGCWNPSEYATPTDWQPGDKVELLDYGAAYEELGLGSALPVVKHEATTGTGWNLSGEHIMWGRCGIVGNYWKALEVQFDFGRKYRVTGVRTDCLDLPFDIYYLAEGGDWVKFGIGLTGATAVSAVVTSACKISWNETNMFQLRGLSTMRSGGGIHAEFLGDDAVRGDPGNATNTVSPGNNEAVASPPLLASPILSIDTVIELASKAPTTATALGAAKLARLTERSVLDGIQACLTTRADWLGVGKDVEDKSSTYSGLQVCAAWSVSHKIVAGHDVAPLGCSLSLRQGQARLAARGSFLANLAVEVTLQQTGATSASGATYALVQSPFVPDPACCLRALPPRPAEISLGARLLLLPLRTSSFPLCKPAAPWQQSRLQLGPVPQGSSMAVAPCVLSQPLLAHSQPWRVSTASLPHSTCSNSGSSKISIQSGSVLQTPQNSRTALPSKLEPVRRAIARSSSVWWLSSSVTSALRDCTSEHHRALSRHAQQEMMHAEDAAEDAAEDVNTTPRSYRGSPLFSLQRSTAMVLETTDLTEGIRLLSGSKVTFGYWKEEEKERGNAADCAARNLMGTLLLGAGVTSHRRMRQPVSDKDNNPARFLVDSATCLMTARSEVEHDAAPIGCSQSLSAFGRLSCASAQKRAFAEWTRFSFAQFARCRAVEEGLVAPVSSQFAVISSWPGASCMLEGQASKVHPPAPLSCCTVPTFKFQSWHLDQEDWNINHNIDNNINNDKLQEKGKATTGTQIVAGIGGFQTICLPQVSQSIVVHPGQKLAHLFASTSLELISFPEEPPCSPIEPAKGVALVPRQVSFLSLGLSYPCPLEVNSSELLQMSETSFDEPLVVPCRWCLVLFLPPVQVVPCGTQLHSLATDLQLVPSQVMPLAHGGPLRCARQLRSRSLAVETRPLRPLGEGLPSFMPSQFGAQRLAASQSAELDCPLIGISGLAAAAVDSDAEPGLKLEVGGMQDARRTPGAAQNSDHVGAEEARPKDNTNNDLYAGLASMLDTAEGRFSATYQHRYRGAAPCAMDAALLDGGPAALSHGESASMQASDSDLAQALQIAAPLCAQQIPPVSQFRFAEPKVQKQVQKQAADAAVGVVCQALPLSKVRVPPLAAGSLMAVHGGRLPQAAPTTAARSCTTMTRSCAAPAAASSRTLRGWLPAGSSKKLGADLSATCFPNKDASFGASCPPGGRWDSGGSIACMARAVLACMEAWMSPPPCQVHNVPLDNHNIPDVELVLELAGPAISAALAECLPEFTVKQGSPKHAHSSSQPSFAEIQAATEWAGPAISAALAECLPEFTVKQGSSKHVHSSSQPSFAEIQAATSDRAKAATCAYLAGKFQTIAAAAFSQWAGQVISAVMAECLPESTCKQCGPKHVHSRSHTRSFVEIQAAIVPQPIAHGQKLAARAGFRPRRVALLHRDAAKQLAGSLTAGHRRRGVVAALSYARLASVHARYPRQHWQERVLTRQLLKFSRQPEALSTFPGLALRKFMSDTAHAGVERKTTDRVRCAQQAQGHDCQAATPPISGNCVWRRVVKLQFAAGKSAAAAFSELAGPAISAALAECLPEFTVKQGSPKHVHSRSQASFVEIQAAMFDEAGADKRACPAAS
ncbi:unnamed protein product [Polarella glacialis]|uniref:Uncharacterized protein n=1 Tax=Polarella glacialis TaxID=89957 RepID=A0A813KZS0_POLGL|nr:unnamed protein product [Polarella glacialis]